MTWEQRNAQKLNNILNMANINVKNRDIYFFYIFFLNTTPK